MQRILGCRLLSGARRGRDLVHVHVTRGMAVQDEARAARPRRFERAKLVEAGAQPDGSAHCHDDPQQMGALLPLRVGAAGRLTGRGRCLLLSFSTPAASPGNRPFPADVPCV
jgi:hypothetical protein